MDKGEIKENFLDYLADETKKRLDTNTTIKFDVSILFEDVFNEERKEWQIVVFVDYYELIEKLIDRKIRVIYSQIDTRP